MIGDKGVCVWAVMLTLWVYAPGVFVCLPLLVARVHRVIVLVKPRRPPVDPLQIGLTR